MRTSVTFSTFTSCVTITSVQFQDLFITQRVAHTPWRPPRARRPGCWPSCVSRGLARLTVPTHGRTCAAIGDRLALCPLSFGLIFAARVPLRPVRGRVMVPCVAAACQPLRGTFGGPAVWGQGAVLPRSVITLHRDRLFPVPGVCTPEWDGWVTWATC